MAEVHAILAAQRERGMAINAEEQSEIVETTALHGADMQFRGQTHLIRVTLPDANVSREEIQALFEAAYVARFQVRLPEIKAVLVNLVTSVIGRRPALSHCLAARAGRALGQGAGRRDRRAPIVRRRALADGAGVRPGEAAACRRASPGRPSSSKSTPPP